MAETESVARQWADLESNMARLGIPDHLQSGLVNHIIKGIPVGSFLTACLDNNLLGAVSHGDDDSIAALKSIMQLLYNYTRGPCWGSEKRRRDWQAKGGLAGHVSA